MQKAPQLPNETERLKALYEYEILDTGPEVQYDDITLLASQICGTSISAISLIDQNRQWFKSKVGITISETPRDISFCGHAIAGTEVFTIPNALNDDRFFDNPFVVNTPYIRFYAGAPLFTPSGNAIGTLCIIDSKPKELSDLQKTSLQALARQVVAQLELKRTNEALRSRITEVQKAVQYITEQESKIIYSEKMATLGEMASGIAHEINNPLTIIVGTVNRLLNAINKNSCDAKLLQSQLTSVEKTAFRISQIVCGLRSFSKTPDQSAYEAVSVRSLIANVISMVNERFKAAGVDLRVPSIPEGIFLECRPPEISQVLVNLLNNSFDAVETTQFKWIELEVQDLDDQVRFYVRDSGCGIPPKNIHKIMQPFFTTKVVGKGVGLGLSIAKGLVDSHLGQLVLESPGPETTFSVTLPKEKSVFGSTCLKAG